MVIFYNKWKKYNEIQLTKNKMDLTIRKMTSSPPSLTKIECLITIPVECLENGGVAALEWF